MKLVVIRGFTYARDPQKKYRYAVVLGMADGRLAVAPCTTYPARTGRVPYGSALLTNQCATYEGSGFTADQVAIRIRDVGLYSVDCRYLRRARQVGVLDLSKDKRFTENFKMLLKEYDLMQVQKFD